MVEEEEAVMRIPAKCIMVFQDDDGVLKFFFNGWTLNEAVGMMIDATGDMHDLERDEVRVEKKRVKDGMMYG